MKKLLNAALLLLAAPALALEVTAVSPATVKGASSADFTLGQVAVSSVSYENGAVVMPFTENKGRKYTDIKLLTRGIYGKLEACFKSGFKAPAKAPAAPKVEVAALKPLRSKARVANAEVTFDGELLVVAGVMASKKEEGAYWVAFPPQLSFASPAFKSSVESAVIAAWARKGKK
ncbi:MAG: hypothetical protein M0025_10050 [Elusimicrobia bacterium]|nr:hypothetical protein [Elusimicrobiota bacterium]